MLALFFILCTALLADDNDLLNPVAPMERKPQLDPSFQWRPAIEQSMRMLFVQHGFRVAVQPKTRKELGGRFFADYGESIKSIRGWEDQDNVVINYINHPLQGSVSSYIYLQNDPKSRGVEFGNTREYWSSRLKALAWSAASSAQFEIGPFSEATIGNVGKRKGTSGCVDFVITPAGGFVWTIAEDWVDKRFIQRWEENTDSATKKSLLRMALNPSRALANILQGKVPWHRYGRSPVSASTRTYQ